MARSKKRKKEIRDDFLSWIDPDMKSLFVAIEKRIKKNEKANDVCLENEDTDNLMYHQGVDEAYNEVLKLIEMVSNGNKI